ncbi:MAG: phosphate ABC transporter substrate-binding protein [Methanosarcinales archaeon]|nr:MAG: phosphate ABC transporter substrate-binding protein [Methanosarcinales archaeon]
MKKSHITRSFSSHTAVTTLILTIAVVAASLLGSGCIGGNGDDDTSSLKLQVVGSTTVLPIATECARVFMENNPGDKVHPSGGGSSLGIKAVVDGIADIGTASRDLKDSELESCPDLVTHVIAKDGVAIVVHPSNPVSDLTLEQLQGIYSGKITNWLDVGGADAEIMVVSREEGSGTRDCFEASVLKPIKTEVTDYAITQNSNGQMRTTVAGNEHGIGFLSLGFVNSDIKAVKLGGIAATVENIRSGEYAISRTLLMITNGAPDADEQLFLDFVLSSEGQEIVEAVHFIPVLE